MFRPCIDLHNGQVKQIVGGTLTDKGDQLETNFVSERSSAWFAKLYRKDELKGGHVIQLGPAIRKLHVLPCEPILMVFRSVEAFTLTTHSNS